MRQLLDCSPSNMNAVTGVRAQPAEPRDRWTRRACESPPIAPASTSAASLSPKHSGYGASRNHRDRFSKRVTYHIIEAISACGGLNDHFFDGLESSLSPNRLRTYRPPRGQTPLASPFIGAWPSWCDDSDGPGPVTAAKRLPLPAADGRGLLRSPHRRHITSIQHSRRKPQFPLHAASASLRRSPCVRE